MRSGGILRLGHVGEHVLRQPEHDRARTAGGGDGEGAGDELGNPLGVVDLRRPFREPAEHLAQVELLERLPLEHRPPDLADEKEERRRALNGGVQPHARVRRPRPPRGQADTRPPGQLPVRLGHVRRTRLVAADDEADRAVVERVEHGEVALAGDAEGDVDAVDVQLVDE